MGFTEKQQQVIDHQKGSLLVSAAAGSGKTSTLVAHIIRRILDPEKPGDLTRMIVVTFTTSAAAEMRDRLKEALTKSLETEQDPKRAAHLRRQAAIVHEAHISTIDSLCNYLVRNYYQQLEMDPDLRLADTGELTLLQNTVLDEMFEEKYEAAEPGFISFMNAYSQEKSDGGIRKDIRSLQLYAQSALYPAEWLEQAKKSWPDTVAEYDELEWLKQRRAAAREELGEYAEEIREWAERMAAEELEKYEAMFRADLAMVEALAGEEDPAAWRLIYESRGWARKPNPPKDRKDPELEEELKSFRDDCKKRMSRNILPWFSDPEEELLRLKQTEGPLKLLLDLTLEYDRRLAEAKRARNIADFGDMEQYALHLLVEKEGDQVRPTALAAELRQHFDEIIIDEYQDINEVQDTMLWALSGDVEGRPNRFLVGDVKQSIYKFRRAKPELFMENYRSFPEREGYSCIELNQNFRSRRPILTLTNEVFRRIMGRELGGIPYDDRAALNFGAIYYQGEDPAPELWLTASEGNAEEKRAAEAAVISREIGRMLAAGVPIQDKQLGLRPVEKRDIVILLRTRGMAEELVERLAEDGIPAVSENKKGYFDTQEIRTLLAVLKILDNPAQDIPLAAVLLSPLGGFSEEDLAEITVAARALEPTPQGLWESLLAVHEADPIRFARLGRFRRQLDSWRDLAERESIPRVLETILRETGYELYLTAMPYGAVRRANVEMLLEQAYRFEKTSYRGLYQFNRYMAEQQEAQVDLGEAPLSSEAGDVVRIMTIHKSKGLEFPVVILAGMSYGFGKEPGDSSILLHERHGVALRKAVFTETREKCDHQWKQFVEEALHLDSLSEELRLLYVAMTRASQKLILSAVREPARIESLIERQAGEKRPDELLPLRRIRAGKCYMDWIEACLQAAPLSLELKRFAAEEEEAQKEREEYDAARLQAQLSALRQEAKQDILTENESRWSRILEFRYPHEGLRGLRGVYSVSALKRMQQKPDMELQEEEAGPETEEGFSAETGVRKPVSRKQEALSGADRGTAYHKLMERLPLKNRVELSDVEAFLEQGRRAGWFSEGEAAVIDRAAIVGFYRTAVGERILRAAAAGTLHREQPFIFGVPAEELTGGLGGQEILLVQGIADLWFEEADGIVLVDYKTDRGRSEEELVQLYRQQLIYYAKALEQATGLKVKERYIYSFALKKMIFV